MTRETEVPPGRFEFKWRKPRFVVYQAADKRVRLGLNRYPRVVIGAQLHIGHRVFSFVWGRPKWVPK